MNDQLNLKLENFIFFRIWDTFHMKKEFSFNKAEIDIC